MSLMALSRPVGSLVIGWKGTCARGAVGSAAARAVRARLGAASGEAAGPQRPGHVARGGAGACALRGQRRAFGVYGVDYMAKQAASRGLDKAIDLLQRDGDVLVDRPTVDVPDPATSELELASSLRRTPTGLLERSLSVTADPFGLVEGHITSLGDSIKHLLGSDHPVLQACAQYFFELDGGKKVRPTMVLLMSAACNAGARHEKAVESEAPPLINESQRRLAEITEMIHTASLFHDDVIDKADTRRGAASVNRVFGDKMAILAGDFLLARASVALARLRSVEAVELLSTVIEHLVKGEVMQMRPPPSLGKQRAAGGDLEGGAEEPEWSVALSPLEFYMRKNYYKTASLMANSCRTAALLGGHGDGVQNAAFAYGKHVGLAFQLVDDILDFEGSEESLGKPALADLSQGHATAPVLLAAEEHTELEALILRKFEEVGDVARAERLVRDSDGLRRAKELAVAQAEVAMEAVLTLEDSEFRDALVRLACMVVQRTR